MSEPKVMVMVGTRKGGFIFTSDRQRKKWQVSDMLFKSWNMMHLRLDPRDGRLHTAVNHYAYGPTTHYSDDFGSTWTQGRAGAGICTGVPLGPPSGHPGRGLQ